MPADFADRFAALEEHIVIPGPKTTEELLASAERNLAAGRQNDAEWDLRMAKISRGIDRLKATLDDDEEDDDA